MVSVIKKYYIFKVNEHYWGQKIRFWDMLKLSAYLDMQNFEANPVLGIRRYSNTIIISLDQDKNAIFRSFSKTFKYQINRSQKEGVDCVYKIDINEFVQFYNKFATIKKLVLINENRIKELKENLSMSFAMFNGTIVAAHSYLVNKELGVAKLFYAASNRLQDGIDAPFVGRANKLLHYNDMLFFKNEGYKIYDWGGYAEKTIDPNLKGINEFKLSFGGTKIKCLDYYSIGYLLLRAIAKSFMLI